MPLVQAGYEGGTQDCDVSPAQRPLHIGHGGQSSAPGAEKQNAQDAVAYDMAAFANVEVPVFKALPVEAEEVMQHRVKNPARIVRGKQRAGFNGNHDQPENRGDPGFQQIVPVGVQAAGLLDAIVGSLAGDHNVVDVALAKSSAADAHKTSFLQQFGDRSATAIAQA